jgi:RHS repeat-associated protein
MMSDATSGGRQGRRWSRRKVIFVIAGVWLGFIVVAGVIGALTHKATPATSTATDGSDNGNYSWGCWCQGTSLVSATTAQNIEAWWPVLYSGYVYDRESNMYYCNARYYDVGTRQWTTPDPAGADGQESTYQYCDGDPVGHVDPTGQKTHVFWTPCTDTSKNPSYSETVDVFIKAKDQGSNDYNIKKIWWQMDGAGYPTDTHLEIDMTTTIFWKNSKGQWLYSDGYTWPDNELGYAYHDVLTDIGGTETEVPIFYAPTYSHPFNTHNPAGNKKTGPRTQVDVSGTFMDPPDGIYNGYWCNNIDLPIKK